MYNNIKSAVTINNEKKPSLLGKEELDATSKGKQVRTNSILNSRAGVSGSNNSNNTTFDNQQEKILEQLITLTAQLRDMLGPSTEKIMPLRTPLAALLDDLRVMQHIRKSTRIGCTPRAAVIGKEGSGKTTTLNFLLNRDAPIIDGAASDVASPSGRGLGKSIGLELDNSLLGTGDFGENQSGGHSTPLAASLDHVTMSSKETAGAATPVHTPSSVTRRSDTTNAQVHRFLNSLAAVAGAEASPTSSFSLSVTPVTTEGQGIFPSAPSNQPVLMSSFGSPNAASAPPPPQRYSDSVARRSGSSPESLVNRSPGQRGTALRSAFIGDDRRLSFSRVRRKSVAVSGGMFDTTVIAKIRASPEVAQLFPDLRTAYLPPGGESIVPTIVSTSNRTSFATMNSIGSSNLSRTSHGAAAMTAAAAEITAGLLEPLPEPGGQRAADGSDHSHSVDLHAVLGLYVSPPEPSLLETTRDVLGGGSDSDTNTLEVSVSTQSSWTPSEAPVKVSSGPSWVVQEFDECVIRWETAGGAQVPLISLADASFLCVPSQDIEASALPGSLSHLFPPLANKPSPPKRDSVNSGCGGGSAVLARWPSSASAQTANEPGAGSAVVARDRGQALRQALVAQTFFIITFTDCVRDGNDDSTGFPSLSTRQEMIRSFIHLMSACYGVRVHASQVIAFSGLYGRVSRDLLTSFLQAVQNRGAEPKEKEKEKEVPRPPSSSSQGQLSSILKRRVVPADPDPFSEKDNKKTIPFGRLKETGTPTTVTESTTGSTTTATSPLGDTAMTPTMLNPLTVLPPRPPQAPNTNSVTGAGQSPQANFTSMGQSFGSLQLFNYRRETFASRPAGTGRLGPVLADALQSYCDLVSDPELVYKKTEQDPLESQAELVGKAVGRAMSDTWYSSGCSQLVRLAQQFETYGFSFVLAQCALSLMLWCAQLLPLFPKAAAVSAARVKRAEERLTSLRYKQAKVHESISRLQLVTPHERVKSLQHRMQCVFSALTENFARDLRRILVVQEEPRYVDIYANEQLSAAFKRLRECVSAFKSFYIDGEAEKKFTSLHSQTESLRKLIGKAAKVEEAEQTAKKATPKAPGKREEAVVEVKCPFVDTKAGDTKQQLLSKLLHLQDQKQKMEHQLITNLSQLNTEIINFFIAICMHSLSQMTVHLHDEVHQSQAIVDDVLNTLSQTKPPSEVLPINALRRSLRTYAPSRMLTMPAGKTLDSFLSAIRASLCEDEVRALAHFRQTARRRHEQQQQQQQRRHSGSSSNSSSGGGATGPEGAAAEKKNRAAELSDVSSPSSSVSPNGGTTTHVKTVVVSMPQTSASVSARKRSVAEDFFPAPGSPKTHQPPPSPQLPSKDGPGDNQNGSILVKSGGPPTTFVLGKRVDHFMQKWCRYYNSNHAAPSSEAGSGESVFAASRKGGGAISLNSTGRDSEYWQRPDADEDVPFSGTHALVSYPTLQLGARRITACYPGSGGGFGGTLHPQASSPSADNTGSDSPSPDRGLGWLAYLAQWRQSTPPTLLPEYFEELPLLWIVLDVWDEALLAMPYQPWVELGWSGYNKFLSDVEAPLFASQQYWNNLLADQIDEIEVNIDALEREVSRLGPSQNRGSAPFMVQQVFDRTAELIERLDTGRRNEPGIQALSVLDAKV